MESEVQTHRHLRQGMVTIETKNGKRNYTVEVPVQEEGDAEAFRAAAALALEIEKTVQQSA